ncbi:MAG TPA: hypothetical protein VER55_11965, partial [Ardenticatenaceae bacterium]|nr:hypothetical protein [Ardenticatenaceae bacterium]
ARGIDPLVAIPLSFAARSARMAFNSAVVAAAARAFPRFFGDFWICLVLGYRGLFGYAWWRLST